MERRSADRRGADRRSGVRRRGAWLKPALVIAVLAIAAFGLEIVVNGESFPAGSILLDAPPEELVGMWVTENPRYSDTPFVIDYDHIELHLGEEAGIRSHPIQSIRAVQGLDSWGYEISYESSGGDLTLGVNLYPDGVLRLRNPPEVVWTRALPVRGRPVE